jgi:hypothetical protein
MTLNSDKQQNREDPSAPGLQPMDEHPLGRRCRPRPVQGRQSRTEPWRSKGRLPRNPGYDGEGQAVIGRSNRLAVRPEPRGNGTHQDG